MPAAEEILDLLFKISNELVLVAISFHILVVAFILALVKGWRPSRRWTGLTLSLPFLSVALIAWIYGNPFTSIVFFVFFLLLAISAWRLTSDRIEIVKNSWLVSAIFMIAFGWFYPHFLDDRPWLYLFAAPTGIIPCPTLSLVIGFTLLFGHFNSKPYVISLSIISLFYGLFGAFRLGVMIDGVLIAGVILLLTQAFSTQKKIA